MSSTWRSSPDTSGPRAKCDQVVYEAIAKAAEIIVHARCPIPVPLKPSSSRFNLHVPEVEAVRASLQRWRRSLHVPLRLDVYYQHDDDRGRELLERWCIEFTPGAAAINFSAECANPDPIVQLRHVCKNIVLWLRTLYCMARLLPAHQLYASHKLCYEIDVLEEWQALEQFKHDTSPAVPTPYGPLEWKVWYAPSIRRFLPTRKTQPIPMATRPNHIAPPPQAKSLPPDFGGVNHHHHHHHAARPPPTRTQSSLDADPSDHSSTNNRPILHRANSLENSTQRLSALSLALLAEESSLEKRRAALHHPPPVESSYGYAYNNASPPTTTLSPAPLSSSPGTTTMPPLSSTPPLFGGNALIPPRSAQKMMSTNTTAPPFATLPTALSEPDMAAADAITEQPLALDLLHSSPFKTGASFSESEVLKHSVVIPPAPDEEDMPFAVDNDDDTLLEDSKVTQLAHKCATASRLQLLDDAQQDDHIMMGSLADQLAEFKSFGASLHMSSNTTTSATKNSNEGSSSTLISMRT